MRNPFEKKNKRKKKKPLFADRTPHEQAQDRFRDKPQPGLETELPQPGSYWSVIDSIGSTDLEVEVFNTFWLEGPDGACFVRFRFIEDNEPDRFPCILPIHQWSALVAPTDMSDVGEQPAPNSRWMLEVLEGVNGRRVTRDVTVRDIRYSESDATVHYRFDYDPVGNFPQEMPLVNWKRVAKPRPAETVTDHARQRAKLGKHALARDKYLLTSEASRMAANVMNGIFLKHNQDVMEYVEKSRLEAVKQMNRFSGRLVPGLEFDMAQWYLDFTLANECDAVLLGRMPSTTTEAPKLEPKATHFAVKKPQ